ncbi:MAG: bacteriohemerythrin [Alphaproteobacteria bacterium]
MVELTETFELQCGELDKDHRRLVEMVNEITAKLDDGVTDDCRNMVLGFINLAKEHFAREEKYLLDIGYPDLGKHRDHHKMLGEKMQHLLEFSDMAAENDMARDSLKKELVYFLMDDIITTDLDFKSYVSDQ